jgi:electron transfer flavoprotein beta subunit
MNIFVCVKQVPDTETKMKLGAEGLDITGVKWILNPYDAHAVEEALKIKAAHPAAVVHVITLGPKARVTEVLVTALAMGADEGILIDSPASMDTALTARALAKAIQTVGQPNLVLTGKLAIDDNQSAVPQMLAEFLAIPHVNGVSKLEFTPENVIAEREIEGGAKEVFRVALPCLIGATKGLNNPRYPSLPGIMKAKKKVLKEFNLEALGINSGEPKTIYSNFQLPPDRPAAKMMSGDSLAQVKELSRLLREEAKVI